MPILNKNHTHTKKNPDYLVYFQQVDFKQLPCGSIFKTSPCYTYVTSVPCKTFEKCHLHLYQDRYKQHWYCRMLRIPLQQENITHLFSQLGIVLDRVCLYMLRHCKMLRGEQIKRQTFSLCNMSAGFMTICTN